MRQLLEQDANRIVPKYVNRKFLYRLRRTVIAELAFGARSVSGNRILRTALSQFAPPG